MKNELVYRFPEVDPKNQPLPWLPRRKYQEDADISERRNTKVVMECRKILKEKFKVAILARGFARDRGSDFVLEMDPGRLFAWVEVAPSSGVCSITLTYSFHDLNLSRDLWSTHIYCSGFGELDFESLGCMSREELDQEIDNFIQRHLEFIPAFLEQMENLRSTDVKIIEQAMIMLNRSGADVICLTDLYREWEAKGFHWDHRRVTCEDDEV